MPSFTVPLETFTSSAGAVAPGHEDGARVQLKAVRPEGSGVWLLGVGAQAISSATRHAQAVEGSVVLEARTVRAAQSLRTAALAVIVLFALALVGGVAGLAWSGGLAIILATVEIILVVLSRRATVQAVLDPDRQLVTISWRD